jgi:hypothetical protein
LERGREGEEGETGACSKKLLTNISSEPSNHTSHCQ